VWAGECRLSATRVECRLNLPGLQMLQSVAYRVHNGTWASTAPRVPGGTVASDREPCFLLDSEYKHKSNWRSVLSHHAAFMQPTVTLPTLASLSPAEACLPRLPHLTALVEAASERPPFPHHSVSNITSSSVMPQQQQQCQDQAISCTGLQHSRWHSNAAQVLAAAQPRQTA
jgi:hypothetical protein